MNERGKAIEALEHLKWNVSTNQIHAITGEYMLINDVCPEYCDIAIQELKKPTIDDAIKVVEEMKNNPNNNFMTMKQVLTALKGLKEGKEKC